MPRFHVAADIARAKTLDTRFYTDPALQDTIRERLLAPSWQFLGDTGLVPDPGAVHPFTLMEGSLNEPLLLTRDQAGAVRLLSNVCTHRGNLLAEKSCTLTHLRCRYHGRTFGLDGRFASMPEFKEVRGFPAKSDDLASLRLSQWGRWLFGSVAGRSPARDYLGDMMDRLAWLPVDDFVLRPELSKDYTVRAHWALYCENYLEGFHIPFVHAGLNAVIDFGNYTTELFRLSNLQLGIAKDDEDCFDLPASSPDHGRKVAAYYWFIFPNLMFNFYPWGLSINLVEPRGLAETRVRFLTYVWRPEKLNTGAGAGLDTVEHEDEDVVEAVQLGVRSRFYRHGRYSVTREQGTHHFHRLIARQMG